MRLPGSKQLPSGSMRIGMDGSRSRAVATAMPPTARSTVTPARAAPVEGYLPAIELARSRTWSWLDVGHVLGENAARCLVDAGHDPVPVQRLADPRRLGDLPHAQLVRNSVRHPTQRALAVRRPGSRAAGRSLNARWPAKGGVWRPCPNVEHTRHREKRYTGTTFRSPEDSRTRMPPKPRHVPVSALARFAADPETFSKPRTRAMEKAAAHGILWHERRASGRRGRRPGWWVAVATALFLVAAVAAGLLLAA